MQTSTEVRHTPVAATRERAEPARRGASAELIEAAYRSQGARFQRLAAAVAGSDAAHDVVQDAFAHALRRHGSWRGDGPLEAWLWRLVLNAARDAERRRLRGTRLAVRLARLVDRGSIQAASVEDELHGPLRALPARQRDCVVLRYYGDLSYAEIGAVMGIEQGTVGALLTKAHAALRAELEDKENR
jgi:RNA polymerase sigma factor (sigma-70 family)